MGRPVREPIGRQLTRTAKILGRAFDDALVAAGGSQPMWLVLITLKSRQVANQRELADAVGIRGATLTHHLNAMESVGLVTRRRHPDNRRVHLVELTAEGDALFLRLREVVTAFDRRIRDGLSEEDVARLGDLLTRLRANVADQAS
ncbi:MAG: MarR family transcriptional regulator [Streptosporangiales bacterium]|nr:MarR family transcriptional regulator [Streptosporangiales bacterium]